MGEEGGVSVAEHGGAEIRVFASSWRSSEYSGPPSGRQCAGSDRGGAPGGVVVFRSIRPMTGSEVFGLGARATTIIISLSAPENEKVSGLSDHTTCRACTIHT